MKKLLLALALLLVLPAARALAQADEVDYLIFEVNDPPQNLTTVYENGALVGTEPILDLTTPGGKCSDVSGTKVLCNLNGLGGSTPTGTGFTHITGGAQDAAAKTVDVSSADVTGTLAAARFPALTGDVTTSAGSLSTSIANAVVTLAKIQNAAANSKLVGSGAAGAGASYSEITLGSGLSMSGTTLSSTGGGVADPGSNGLMSRTALNTAAARTLVCAAAYCSYTNGDGVSGNPSLAIALTTTNPGGAVVAQSSTPGTMQTSTNFNIDGVGISEHDNITTTRTDGLFLSNTTASSGGVTVQMSPSLKMCGTAWNSSGSASELDCFRIHTLPQTNAGATTSRLQVDSSIAGGAYTQGIFSLSQTGGLTLASALTLTSGNATIGTAASYLFSGRGGLQNGGSDGVFQLANNAGTITTAQLDVGIQNLFAANGSGVKRQSSMEALTLATGSTTTNTAGNLVTGPCKLIAVLGRVTTTITTAANFTVKVTGGNVLAQIGTATTSNTTLTSGTTYTWVPNAFADQYYTSSTTLTVTTNVNPGAGAIRLVAICETFTPPTS